MNIYAITMELHTSSDLTLAEVKKLIKEQWEYTPAAEEGDQLMNIFAQKLPPKEDE